MRFVTFMRNSFVSQAYPFPWLRPFFGLRGYIASILASIYPSRVHFSGCVGI